MLAVTRVSFVVNVPKLSVSDGLIDSGMLHSAHPRVLLLPSHCCSWPIVAVCWMARVVFACTGLGMTGLRKVVNRWERHGCLQRQFERVSSKT